ncbi:PspC domain-containing protein [Bifidobacterium sp. ESL0682]|uniref:PspC domain-containing protein n=1 Tax=Bifidobacterium sp. ESL0682 TaxID=2983212 RepID=UPI0023F92D46|nr:PspC domain-containing protein [Bifidobacterium sp. ESL0682]WEV42373.1 PspC domain-containing protein [Bifidobacterium sp. ESL0682]
MSNNTNGYGYQQPNNMSNPVPPRHDKIDRFFAWIRGSGLMRGNNRWIAGVCDGIAVRYGLSPVFVRAIVAASTLVFGFGAAFYAAAWVLLPDCRDGRISGEELVYGHWQWSLLGPILFMIIAFCSPGVGVLLAIIAVAVLLIMINSLANKAQQQRGTAYANNARQHQPGQWQAQPPQGQYQAGPMPYDPSGNVNRPPNPNPTPYAPQPWQQGQNDSQSGSQGNNEATFREQTGVNPDNRSATENATAQPVAESNNGSADSASSDSATNFNLPYGEQTSARPSASPFAASSSRAGGIPPTYMAEPQQTYPQASQSTARPWGPRRTRRKPAGFVVVLLTLGVIFLSGALVAIQCFSNGGYLSTIFQYGTYWIAAILILLGVIIAVLGLVGRRAGGLHPLVWIAAFVAVVFMISDIGYSLVLTGLEQTSTFYHQVNVSGFKAIDGGNGQQFNKLKQGTAIKGHRLDDDAINIDLSDYGKTHDTHDVVLKDGSTVQSDCPTGTIHLTNRQATVFVTLPAGCSYELSHESDSLVDGGRISVDTDEGSIVIDGGYAGSAVGTESLGSGYVAIGRNMQLGIGGMSYRSIDSGRDYGNEKEYEWITDSRKMPKNGPELTIDAPYIVEGRVTVQYPDESTVPSYAQFAKGKTEGEWRR